VLRGSSVNSIESITSDLNAAFLQTHARRNIQILISTSAMRHHSNTLFDVILN